MHALLHRTSLHSILAFFFVETSGACTYSHAIHVLWAAPCMPCNSGELPFQSNTGCSVVMPIVRDPTTVFANAVFLLMAA